MMKRNRPDGRGARNSKLPQPWKHTDYTRKQIPFYALPHIPAPSECKAPATFFRGYVSLADSFYHVSKKFVNRERKKFHALSSNIIAGANLIQKDFQN
jgi:hypothetical protein